MFVRVWWVGVSAVVPFLVILSVWLPLWFHYWVPSPLAQDAVLTALRLAPDDRRLIEIEDQGNDLRATVPDSDVVRQARRLRGGTIDLPNGEMRSVSLPFDPQDYQGGSPGGALKMASLVVPATLLRAYELQHDEGFFRDAKEAILRFSRYERDIATDVGFIRNDHATAARIGVLVKFWRLYRQRDDFKSDEARIVLQQISRCALLLAKASNYTAATNHGVMQNIALLQIGVAFPALREAALGRLARGRLERQMAYYLHSDGVVLEHSPGYHRFGIWLVGLTIRLLQLNGLPEIPGLLEKYARGMSFLDRLTRLDGSIPRIGDTNGKIVDRPRPAVAKDATVTDVAMALADGTKVYVGSGYAITARPLGAGPGEAQSVSHSTVYWSHFPRHGHEVAAEGSFLLWAAGRNWIGNTGYWPYGLPGRDEATGWRGSNAPHLVGESASGERFSRLLGTAANAQLHLVDLERTLPDGGTLRRQITQLSADTWVILDSVSDGTNSTVERMWSLDPGLEIKRSGSDALVATDPESGWRLALNFVADQQSLVRELHGSLVPFGGWAVIGPMPIPSPAFVATQASAGRWFATVLTLVAPGAEVPAQRPAFEVVSAEQWSLELGGGTPSATRIERRVAELHITVAGSAARVVEISPPNSDGEVERRLIAQLLDAELRAFPKFMPYETYRRRLIRWLIAPGLASAGIGIFVGRAGARFRFWLTFGAIVSWALLAGWIHFVYLAS